MYDTMLMVIVGLDDAATVVNKVDYTDPRGKLYKKFHERFHEKFHEEFLETFIVV